MKTLRYWLGLPLYNLMLWAVCVVFVKGLVDEPWEPHNTLFVCIAFSVLTVPFAVSLYYPVEREDCRPLWQPVVISFAAIFIVAQITLTVLIETFLGATFIAVMLAFAELTGYAIGLLIKNAELKKSGLAQSLNLTPLKLPNEAEQA